MGYPYNCLIAPAVLFHNPGVTREEFVELLDKTHSACFREYKTDEAWNDYCVESEDTSYHRGLKGLADLLGLDNRAEFNEFQKSKFDEHGLKIQAPLMLPAREGESHAFEVTVHERNVFEEPRLENSLSWDKLRVGDVWIEPLMGSEQGIVLKIFKKVDHTDYTLDEDERNYSPNFDYKMKIRPFNRQGRVEHFQSEEELVQKWPQYHIDFVKDWSQSSGHFLETSCFMGDNFLWRKEHDKYYLDEKTLDRIPASNRCGGSLGYTDLILTLESVKREAWKILSYKGLQHYSQFINDFPDVLPVLQKAVWDSHSSLSAKQQGMNHFEFLRYRLESNLK